MEMSMGNLYIRHFALGIMDDMQSIKSNSSNSYRPLSTPYHSQTPQYAATPEISYHRLAFAGIENPLVMKSI